MSFITKYILLGSASDYTRYAGRVSTNAGSIRNPEIAKKIINFYKQAGQLNNIRLLVAPELGMTVFNDGNDLNISKLYSVDSVPNDVVQGTAASQPYLGGDIAPTEKYSLNNPNGATRYMTHPTISYSATDKWSVTFVINVNGIPAGDAVSISGKSSTSRIALVQTNNRYYFQSESGTAATGTIDCKTIYCKNSVISYVAKGDNTVLVYENGSLKGTLNGTTDVIFELILKGRFSNFFGKLYFYKIQNGDTDAAFVKSEYDMLRSIYPEIESVQIGTQTWATSNFEAIATPMGNIINEVQINSNTEKISDTNFALTANQAINTQGTYWRTFANTSIVSNQLVADGLATGRLDTQIDFTLQINKWYKKTVNVASGTARVGLFLNGSLPFGDVVGNYTEGTTVRYFKCTAEGDGLQVLLYNSAGGTACVLNEISLQEVGWANSTDLYNALIAQGSSVEVATREAAMWCHYNNSTANGAIYGKLYNWYAIKLLQTDIDLYNTANPTNRWGWHVPTQAEFNTLATYLGGASVAGGKLKKEGLTYWNTPNTGATNESGFSAIGGGYRNASGSFTNRTGGVYFVTITNSGIYFTYYALDASLISLLSSEFANKIFGISLRLIKEDTIGQFTFPYDSSTATTVEFRMRGNGDIIIEWGDGVSESYTLSPTVTTNYTHTYTGTSGTKNINIVNSKYVTLLTDNESGGDNKYKWNLVDIDKFRNLTRFIHVQSGHTDSGSITNLINLTSLFWTGSNTGSGNITNLVNLTYLNWQGNNTGSGSITNLTNLTYLAWTGNNTGSGSITNLINLTFLYWLGSNTGSGSINLLTKLQYYSATSSGNTIIPPTNLTNHINLSYFIANTSWVLTSTQVNQYLADFWLNRNQPKQRTERTIDLRANTSSQAPTGQGLIDKEALAAYRSPTPPGTAAFWTVLTR